MRSEILVSVVGQLRRKTAPPATTILPDAELVQAFAARRDGSAFEAIVRRHGPMVLGVCRRYLRDPADADDAFQATFLVLVRKAAALRQPERLAAWLHQVAVRTARKARGRRQARAIRESELFDAASDDTPADLVWRELRPIFDQELGRLPDKLRLPAILCFLEGHSKGEAARTLGWPEGTLAGRLQKAREKLRARFAARGLTLSAGSLAVALFEAVGKAAVPDRLIASTLHAAAMGPAGMTGAWVLADGVTQAMLFSKVKAVAAAMVVVGALGTGTGVVLVPGAGPGEVAARESPKGGAKTSTAADGTEKKANADLDRARVDLALAELNRRNAEQQAAAATERLRQVLTQKVQALRTEVSEAERLFKIPAISEQQLNEVRSQLAAAAAQLAKMTASATASTDRERDEVWKDFQRNRLSLRLKLLRDEIERENRLIEAGTLPQDASRQAAIRQEIADKEKELKALGGEPINDGERFIQREGLRILKERLSWEERMVKKGFLSEAQLNRTKADFARAEAELAKLEAPKPVDPRRAAMAEAVQKQEQMVEMIREGVRKGIVPEVELLNAQAALARYQSELARVGQPTTAPGLERAARDRQAAQVEMHRAQITLKEAELRRAEALLKQNAISQEEVRRLRLDLAGLRAEAAEAVQDQAAALRSREEVVRIWESMVDMARQGVERKAMPRSELRTAEIALAEAKVEMLHCAARNQLAAIVQQREQELAEAKILFEARTLSMAELQRAEQAVIRAKLRLAEGR